MKKEPILDKNISKKDIEYAKKEINKYIDNLKKLTNAHQTMIDIQQKQDNIVFGHVFMISEPFIISKAVFVIYQDETYIWVGNDTNFVVDHTSLSEEGGIIFSKELLFSDEYHLFLPEILEYLD